MMKIVIQSHEHHRLDRLNSPCCVVADTKFQDLHATRVVNREAAEVDDVSVIRDNEHLFVVVDNQVHLGIDYHSFVLFKVLAWNAVAGRELT